MITPAYAAFAGLMLRALSFRIIRQRRRTKIGVGSEGDMTLTKAPGKAPIEAFLGF